MPCSATESETESSDGSINLCKPPRLSAKAKGKQREIEKPAEHSIKLESQDIKPKIEADDKIHVKCEVPLSLPFSNPSAANSRQVSTEPAAKRRKLSTDGSAQYLSRFLTRVRGCQYHEGRHHVEPNASLDLVRFPNNSVDSDAIMVTCDGHQVGFLPRSVNRSLSPFIDAGRLTIYGKCGHLSGPAFLLHDIPIFISCYGDQDLIQEPSIAYAVDKTTRKKSTKARPVAKKLPGFEDTEMDETDLPLNLGPMPDQIAHMEELSRNQRRLERGDNIFQEFFKGGDDAHDVALLGVCQQPPGLRTTLLKHQLQGLRWMAEMEHPRPPTTEEQRPVQLWSLYVEQDTSQHYFNLGTKEHTTKAPDFARGGILADDMGLGKTLTTLALIKSDPLGRGLVDAPDADLDTHFCKATLIICPLSVVDNWREQIQVHIGSSLVCDYHLYHGSEGTRIPRTRLAQCDIVITTYGMVTSEYHVDADGHPIPTHSKRKRPTRNGNLFRIPWRRIVLDEGHLVRNPKTTVNKGCCLLIGERRWVLTGTPLINAPADLGALLAFTQLCPPYNEGHTWSNEVERKVKAGKNQDEKGSSLLRAIVQSSTLRRTKATKDSEGKPIVNLPPIHISKYLIKLDDDTRKVYDMAHGAVKERVEVMMMNNEAGVNWSCVLVYLLHLRQLACATALCPQDFIDAARNRDDLIAQEISAKFLAGKTKTLKPEQEELIRRTLYNVQDEECPICSNEPFEVPAMTPCLHAFCQGCIMEHITMREENKVAGKVDCPMCRQPISANVITTLPADYRPAEQKKDAEQEDDDLRHFHAAKGIQLVHLLRQCIKRGERSLVFSQWTTHLRHLGKCFDKVGITHAQFDGTMTVAKRDEVVAQFRKPNGPRVLMLSLAAGGLGLNLTVANNVFLMDPWWQGQTEQQAIDRCYRIGQTREVHVFHLVAEDTIEDRVFDIQQRKSEMIKDAFSGSKGSINNREAVPRGMADVLAMLGSKKTDPRV